MPQSQAQDVGREYGDAGSGSHARKSFLRAGLAVCELIAADHDGDQAGDLGDRSGEQGLQVGESGIEG